MTEQERKLLEAQHGIEQLGAMMHQLIVPHIASYYKALIAEGLPAPAARALTADLQGRYLALMGFQS